MSKDKAKDWELEKPLYNFYNLNPVDMSYNFSYDTGQLCMRFILQSFSMILQAGPLEEDLTGLRRDSTVEM
jgi:hypothetical protein